jgi:hypothetical protein
MKQSLLKILCGCGLFLLAAWPAYADKEQELLGVLQSSADIPAKCDACKELRRVGTARAVPGLAACLNEDRLSQAARFALEGMPCPEATQALREALNKTSGALKAGVIDSLGWKRDLASIAPLTALLTDADPTLASAAASSLGRLGAKDATAALISARDRVAPAVKPTLLEALLRCADGLLAGGDTTGAATLYSSLTNNDLPQPIRLAAWRGQVLTDPTGRASQIFAALKGTDPALRVTAMKVLREAQAPKVVAEGLSRWSSLNPEAQLAVLDAAMKFTAEQTKAISLAAQSPSAAVRQAAWLAMAEANASSPAQIKALAKAATEGQSAEQEAARDALARLHGKTVSDSLRDLAKRESALRPELLRAFGERRESSAEPLLLQYAAETGPSRSAALEALRKLAAPATLSPLLALAAASKTDEDAQPVVEAAHAVCQASPDKGQATIEALGLIKGYNEVQRRRVLPLLAVLATPDAFQATLEATRSTDPELRKTALRTLAEWPNAAPASALLDLAKTASEPASQTLALRGAIKVAAYETELAQKLTLLTNALALASRVEEKRAALGQIGQIATSEALAAVLVRLKDPDLVEEAAQAAVAIAEKLAPSNPKLAAEAADAVLASSKAPEIVKRARALQQTKQIASGPYIQDWLVCGPFTKQGVEGARAIFLVPFGPEKGEAVEWKAMPKANYADLLGLFPNGLNCVAYLKAQIISSAATDATLLLGSDDGVKAWLNGKVVHSNNARRKHVPDQDKAPIHLNSGTNDLLLKISQGNQGWMASARIVGADGSPVPGLRVEPQSAPPATRAQTAQPQPVVTVPATLPPKDSYKKLRLSDQFCAEGACCADINHDGKLDIVAGPFWFEGPDFKTRHEYRPVKAFEAAKEYSDNFLTYSGDFNNDGWPDILCVPFPGKEGFWYENPAGKEVPWKSHLACSSIGNESPVWGDIMGSGHPQLLLCKDGFLGYIVPDPAKPDEPWAFHAISTKDKRYHKFTHGVGFGDINGDKRNDVVEAAGWWEQPAQLVEGQSWIWHPFRFAAEAAQMYVYDVNGDGLADVITAWHCHWYGLVWWEQLRGADGKIDWRQHVILPPTPNLASSDFRVSQMHAMVLADMNGDGLLDIVTGKRFWAHGPTGDKESDAPAVVFWLELRRGGPDGATFIPHLIDDDSGVGTQVTAVDLNGDKRPDIVVANKKSIFVHLSEGK